MAAVYASTGHPILGVTDTDSTQPTVFTASTTYVNVTAGGDAATTNGAVNGFFAINFGTFSGAQLVTFSGAQFSLYLSKDGLSQISAGDVPYTGPTLFSVADLTTNAGWHKYTETNGTFWVGQTTANDEVLVGPMPTKISNAYKYIKIFDGSSSSVAVSAQYINILPGITITPTSGAAGTSVAVSGGGFPASTTVDINYSYPYQEWASASTTAHGQWITGIATGLGWFTTTAAMVDTKQAVNPVGPPATVLPTVVITLTAVTHSAPHKAYPSATAAFTEWSRIINQEFSYKPDGSVGGSANSGPYGNDTGTTGAVSDLPTLNAYVTGSIGLEGNYSQVGSTVAIWIGATQVASATANGVSGLWKANFTVPVLPKGSNTVKIVDNGVTYEFNINIVPTLVLTPSSGPIGTTVTVTAYGFAPTGKTAPVVLYWFEYSYGTGFNYWIGNATVGSNGAFNTTSPVTFLVHHAYGGGHIVTASNTCVTSGACKVGGSTGSIPGPDIIQTATFTITSLLVVCDGSNCGSGSTASNTVSIPANNRTTIVAWGTGFVYHQTGSGCSTPGQGWYLTPWYQVNIDNALYQGPYISDYVNATGDWALSFSAAGFRPGLHQIDVYNNECPIEYPANVAYFNVTVTGDYVVGSIGDLHGITTTLNTINTNVNTILSWGTTITTMSSNVNTINTNVNTILGWGTTINHIASAVDGLTTNLQTVSSTLGTAAADAHTAATQATAAATAAGNAATQAQNAATSAGNAATAATNAGSSVSNTQTYVLVVAVLAAITLVLELAVLIRRLS